MEQNCSCTAVQLLKRLAKLQMFTLNLFKMTENVNKSLPLLGISTRALGNLDDELLECSVHHAR